MPAGTIVASLLATLKVDDSQFRETLKDSDTGLKGLGSKIQSFGANTAKVGAGLTLIGAPFAALVSSSIQSFEASQNVTAQLMATLQSTGQAAGISAQYAEDYASALQSVTRYSDETILAGENVLLTFTNIKGDAFKGATQAALDLSTAMGQDLQSSVVQIGKALNDPINGITSLTRVGVTFTEQQKDQIAAMVKSGDTMGAQKLILAELSREFGGSALAAGQTFAGQQDILANKLDDLKEKLGAVAVQALPPLTDALNGAITAFTGLPQPMQDMIMKGIVLLAGLVVLGPIVTAVGGAIGLLGIAIGAVSLPAIALAGAIAGIIFVMDKLYPGGLKKLLLDASQAAQQLATIMGGIATNAINQAADALSKLQQIAALIMSGQLSPQQVLNAVGNEISGNAGGSSLASNLAAQAWGQNQVQPIPPVGGGSGGAQGIQGGNFTNNGGIHITANSVAEGQAAMTGALNAARNQGH